MWHHIKSIHGGISILYIPPSTTMSRTKLSLTISSTPVPTFKITPRPTLRIMFRPEPKITIRPNMRPTLRPTFRPYLIPTECFTQTPLLHLSYDDENGGEHFGPSVSVFEYWSSIGSTFSDKGRAYLYRRFLGPGNIINCFSKTMGVEVIGSVSAWQFMEKHGYRSIQ